MPGHIDLNDANASHTLRALEDQLSQGHEVFLTRDGAVVARVVPLTPGPVAVLPGSRRGLAGLYAGRIHVSDDAFTPDEGEVASFYEDNLVPDGTLKRPKNDH
ncbi:hypothetical protein [Niveispirillum sp. BGYR6]|uniref:type II toxin-antitoxin system Phd/YefM family antitoxin n=1 Tax=Niveispirillum sp. BGYR6 TaxID=2971249 RepID=UPI0022B9AAF2|nr:hypothetical protein [Niveispirillum sp. BGYR6]MDG5495382.1 hypothetical protein [Niveispirillum sp. BGYR6]